MRPIRYRYGVFLGGAYSWGGLPDALESFTGPCRRTRRRHPGMSVRLWMDIFSSIRWLWFFTVPCEILRVSAMSLLGRPSAISRATSVSLGDSARERPMYREELRPTWRANMSATRGVQT